MSLDDALRRSANQTFPSASGVYEVERADTVGAEHRGTLDTQFDPTLTRKHWPMRRGFGLVTAG